LDDVSENTKLFFTFFSQTAMGYRLGRFCAISLAIYELKLPVGYYGIIEVITESIKQFMITSSIGSLEMGDVRP